MKYKSLFIICIIFLFIIKFGIAVLIPGVNYCDYAPTGYFLPEQIPVIVGTTINQPTGLICNTSSYYTTIKHIAPFNFSIKFNSTVNFPADDLTLNLKNLCSIYAINDYKIYSNDTGTPILISSQTGRNADCFNVSTVSYQTLIYPEFSAQNIIIQINTVNETQLGEYIAHFFYPMLNSSNNYFIGNNTLPNFNISFDNLILQKNNLTETTFNFSLSSYDEENDTIYYSTSSDNNTFSKLSFYQDFLSITDSCSKDYADLYKLQFITNCSKPLNSIDAIIGLKQIDIYSFDTCTNALWVKPICQDDIVYNFGSVTLDTTGYFRFFGGNNMSFNMSFIDGLDNEIATFELYTNATNLNLKINNSLLYSGTKNYLIGSSNPYFIFNYSLDFTNKKLEYWLANFGNDYYNYVSLNTLTFEKIIFKQNNIQSNYLIRSARLNTLLAVPVFTWSTIKPTSVNINNNLNTYDLTVYVTDEVHKEANIYNKETIRIKLTDYAVNNDMTFNSNEDDLNFEPPTTWSDFKKLIWTIQFPKRLSIALNSYEIIKSSLASLLLFAMIFLAYQNFILYNDIQLFSVLSYGSISSFILTIIGVMDFEVMLIYMFPMMLFIAINIKNMLAGNNGGGSV